MDAVRCGTVVGTGAAINVQLGWIPDMVIITNCEDGDRIDVWHRNAHSNGESAVITTAVADNAADGISAYAGSDTPGSEAKPGFTIGTDISEADKTLGYVAFRNVGPSVSSA